jgi:hypothetical protein
MKSIILILALVGIILIASGYIKSNLQCPPQKIEYRYISKTFEDEQDVQKPILSINSIYNMFENDSPWMVDNSYASADIKYKY